jgi:cytochrome oxidase Cu insertion factor (SCO1/SenC/PrrC family)
MSSPVLRPRGSRRTFWWLLLIFAAPLALSFLLYYGSSWRPAGRTNHGELIEPPRPLPPVALPRADGSRADAGLLQGKWSLVYVGGGQCDDTCREALYFLRQTYLSLGKLMPRMQRVFLAAHDCCAQALGSAEPDLVILNAAGPAAADLLAVFPAAAAPTAVYVVDPRGNLMMRYDARADPKGLREDLKKLLDLSHIG